MELKIKSQFLDSYVTCPLTKKQELVRFIDKRLYNVYNNKGLSYLFEEIKTIKVEDVISEQPSDTTGSNS